MPVTVKFFAGLGERLQRREISLHPDKPLSALQVWQEAAQEDELPVNVLVAINQTYAKADSMVKDGDEVGFFPPVSGG